MAETPLKLTVEQRVLVTAAADELSETTNIHQQAILRMLAVADEHNLNAANLLQDLGVEMKSATARQIPFVVEDLQSGLSAEEAFARTPGVVPKSAVMAIAAAESKGLRKALNQALLNTNNRRKSGGTGEEDLEAIDRVTKLAWKYFFATNVLIFMMLFVIPQFKAMFEEFGVELPLSMQLLIEVSNLFAMYWFVFALILLAIGAYIIWRHPRFLTSYFTRWIPSRWQQPVVTKRVQRELSLAWVVQTTDAMPQAAKQFINENGVGDAELERLAANEKTESSNGVFEALMRTRVFPSRSKQVVSTASSRESAAWILRKMSSQNQFKRRQRGLTGVRVLMWLGDFCLMALAAWSAIAIFQSLLTIIWRLHGYV